MPKPTIHINEDIIRLLSFELGLSLGFRIRSKADCGSLSNYIKKKELGIVSESTLYRLLIHKNSNHTPYLHTLDILARVCGKENWTDFERLDESRREFIHNLGNLNYRNKPSLIYYVVRNENFKALSEYLKQIDGSLLEDEKYLLGLEVYNALAKMKDNKAFFNHFSMFSEIRIGFFEYLADPDFHLNDYEYGLERYIESSEDRRTKKGLQDRIFAHSLLFRWNYLNGNNDKALHHGRILYETINPTELELKHLHVFPKSRFLCYKLFYFLLVRDRNNFNAHFFNLLNCFSLVKKSNDEKRMLFHTIIDTFSHLPNEFESEMRRKILDEFQDLFIYLPDKFQKMSFKELAPYFSKNATDWYRYYGLITHEE